MSQVRFQTYDALRLKIQRSGIKQAGSTATLLLSCFLLDGGRLRANDVYARKLAKSGEFQAWRKKMITKKWIEFAVTSSQSAEYRPGRNLLPYLNKEKLSSREIATIEEVREGDKRTEERVEKLEKEVNALRQSIERTLSIIDPPVDEEKVADFQAGQYDSRLKQLCSH